MAKKKNNNKKRKSKNILYPIIIFAAIIAATFLFDEIVIKIVEYAQIYILFEAFYIITLLGEWYVFIWIALFLAIMLLITRKPVIPFIFALALSTLTNVFLKLIINRPRPFESMNIATVINTNMSSFPSGHAMLIFCIVPVMSKYYPQSKYVFWMLAILVSISRVYLGVHYLSDIVAGAILGYALGWLSLKIGEKYGWKY